MLVKEVFKVVKNEGLLNSLVDHIEYEIYEDGYEMFEDEVSEDEYEDTTFMINKMISEYTDSDRFAGWLEGDAEEFDIDFDQLEEVWETYQKEIIEYVVA